MPWGDVSRIELDNGVMACIFSSNQYVKLAVANLEIHSRQKGRTLQYKAMTPSKSGYHPEVNVSDELDDTNAAYYQSLIGILRR